MIAVIMKQVFRSVFSRFLGLLFILVILFCPAANGNITILPETQYVYLNHNVIFECAINLTGYTLSFSYGGSISSTVKQTNLPDGGIKVTTTFIVTNGNNGTSGTNSFISTSKVYAYAQGPPGAVSNLQGYQLDYCCIVFSWSPSFTLGQLSVWYQVTLSLGEEVMSSEVIYTINYTYCPVDLTNGEYRLNITTINGAGTGIWNNNTTMFKTDQTVNTYYNNHMIYRQNDDWTYHFEIKPSTQLCTQSIINTTVMSCNLKNSFDCYNSTNVTIITDSNGNETIASKIDLPPREKFTTCIFLQYNSGQLFQTTPVVTSSHDLQQLIPTNISNDILCLQFIFVNGSTINEVHLHLHSDYRLHLFDNEDLSHNNQLNFTQCFSGNNWTLYVCDGALPQDNKTCSNQAVILNDIRITRNVPNSSSISSSAMPTNSLDIKNTSTGTTIGSFFGIVIFVIIVVIGTILSIYLLKRRCSKRIKGKTAPNQQSPNSTVSNIEDLVFLDKHGKATFNKESSVVIYNIPIPVQDDRHEENPNNVLVRAQDDNPQSSSSSLPLYGDVLSRSKTTPPPSVQSNVTNSGTSFQSSTCSIERESKETGVDISKPLHCLDTSLELQLAFVCNSPPSNNDESPSSVSLDVSVKEVNNRPKAPPNVQADVTYSELIIQSN